MVPAVRPYRIKAQTRRHSRGFTLIELLVVITIIAILAGLLLTAIPAAIQAARKAKAKTEMSSLVTAIESYDQDYGRFPMTQPEQAAANGSDFTTGLVGYGPGAGANGYSYDNNSNTIAILMDLTAYPNGSPTMNVGNTYNPKQVKYLNATMSGYDPSSGGQPLPGVDNTGVYRDPWGNPYVITMNSSYNEQGTSDILYSLASVSQNGGGQTGYNGLFNPTGTGNNFLYHGKVMVWSTGPDKQYDTGPASGSGAGANKDNVLSWQ